MAKIVSFVVLVAILLVIGGLFLEVMSGFLLPLFLALVLAVMFGPLHRWFLGRCGKHERIAALLTTGSILLIVLVPLLLLLAEAGYEAQALYRTAAGGNVAADASAPDGQTGGNTEAQEVAAFAKWASDKLVELGSRVGIKIDPNDLMTNIGDGVRRFLTPLALRTTQFLGQTLLGLLVMILAAYYFFADGPAMLQAILRLSPLEDDHTRALLDQFDGITRTVIVATLLSAFVQGLLAGAGFFVAGIGSVFLLTALSMLFTLVPFVGAAIVWVPVCLWLFAVEGRTLAAVLLAIYCCTVVSMADNLIKPLVLHGRSNLHPLLALLSVLGGVQALGPIGILVGPMVVAFLQTLLNMVHAELAKMTARE
ncbi:MAG: AI-2E family transporter [Planctomycetes bacterium]|nr:AI-2E family transporter [Planctomycetota bacterium]MBU4400720.1 AI-2E family transporter [Planctomycetota bacterium]MCG2682873.1 AI-2E family transporter [Planctomycetales bacterium]